MSPLNVMLLPVANTVGMAFAVRHLAAPEDSDLDHRPLGQLAEQFAAEVVGAVVERDDRSAAQEHGAEALLGFLDALRGGDDWAEPAGGDHGDEIDEIALAGSGRVGADEQDRRRR